MYRSCYSNQLWTKRLPNGVKSFLKFHSYFYIYMRCMRYVHIYEKLKTTKIWKLNKYLVKIWTNVSSELLDTMYIFYCIHSIRCITKKNVKHYNSSRPGKIPSFCQRKPTIFCLLLGWAKRSIEHLWFFTPGSNLVMTQHSSMCRF